MSATINKKHFFSPLTGIRAIVAFMVCLFHFNPFSKARVGSFIHDFFNEFHVGVTFFFVLSGFLIAYLYFDQTEINFKQYFINRFARIYPVYFILTTVFMLQNLVHLYGRYDLSEWLVEYGLNVSLLKGLFEEYKFTGILQAWSLTVEECFYLFAPFAFLFIRKKSTWLYWLPILLLLLGYALVALFIEFPFYGFWGTVDFMISYTFLGRAFEFFVGIALAIIFLRRSATSSIIVQGSYLFTALGVINSVVCIFGIAHFKGDLAHGIDHPIGKLINNFILPLVGIGSLYWGLITERTWLSRLLSTRLFIVLGKSSYVFYLIHLWVAQFNANFMFVFIVSSVLSLLIYKFVEDPLHKWMKRILIVRKAK
jgi:peptidoglycan/LPS O-acetylase OafA/YrhL